MKEKCLNKKLNAKDVVLNGIIKENPVFRLVLGMCPTLAVTTSAMNGLGMGLAVIFVLVCSNTLVSMLRNFIPDKVRIPAFITIIATFVTMVDMIMKKFIPALYESLGLFIPLIVVNCVILARAESFASKNKVVASALDGLGSGLGFTIALTIIGMIREFLGGGSFFGLAIPGLSDFAMTIFILPAGGFLTFGMLMAALNAFNNMRARKKKEKDAAAKDKAAQERTAQENTASEAVVNQAVKEAK